VPAGEAWFWEKRWQDGEREVDALVADKAITVTEGVDEFLQSLPTSGDTAG
jgi:hypothetical protein